MENESDEKPKVTKYQFFFETPLYEFIGYGDLEKDIFKGEVDAYSAKNGIDTTYSIYSQRVDSYSSDSFYNYYRITLTCKRKGNDRLNFLISITEEGITKVGQDPSLADIQFARIGKKYDKLLSGNDLKEFKKAIGLAAYGVGAGSFVYLRRIFEKLIFDTFQTNKEKFNIKEEDFRSIRMVDKVDLLKNFLPEQLLDMKEAYSILSKGVHELSEEDCLKYFSVLKLSIELMLEEQIEKKKEQDRQKQIKSALKNIAHSLATKD